MKNNDTASSKILFVGLPATGKTSFLAALRHYVDADVIPRVWRQYKYGDDTEYLNQIHDKWLACEQQNRTAQEQKSGSPVEIFLENLQTGDRLTLHVPDIEGEVFTQQWEARFWNDRYEQLVQHASGLLFFVNPEKIISQNLLTGMGELVDSGFLEAEDPAEVVDWKIELVPTQVVMVDLLQFHLERMPHRPLAVSILISAWDVVKGQDEKETPEEWLRVHLPLLHQFILANPESLQVRLFGVSAQGGDFGRPEDLTRLQGLDEPAHRVTIQQHAEINHDITAPIQWILDAWRAPRI